MQFLAKRLILENNLAGSFVNDLHLLLQLH